MSSWIINLWRNVASSFWFIPSLAVVLAVLFAWALVSVDDNLRGVDHSSVPWLFGGTADAARSILSTIAGSLITVISIAFSLTVIALQQASSQFSPRVLRRFTGDRVNQIVLGSYIGTFVYALVVLREVRSSDGERSAFVPALSVSIAIALAIACVVMLILFIHHISQMLQVDMVQKQIHEEMLERLDVLYPSTIAEPVDDDEVAETDRNATGPQETVRSSAVGFVRAVDASALLDADLEGVARVHILVRVGSFVAYGDPLATFSGVSADEERCGRAIREAIVIDSSRSAEQDLLFDVRQLVDIALRALSPGINDPTTAEHALYYLGDVLGRLGQRPFPSKVRGASGRQIRIVLSRPDWDDYVAESFDQIRDSARGDVHVLETLRDVLRRLERTVPAHRAPAVQSQLLRTWTEH